MRQQLGPKKLRRYSKLLGMEFNAGLVRGGTGHRVDLWSNGTQYHYWPQSAHFERAYDPALDAPSTAELEAKAQFDAKAAEELRHAYRDLAARALSGEEL